MLENNIRLISISHMFHILPGDLTKLFVCQLILGRGIQRSMEDRIDRTPVGFEVRSETLHAGVNIHSPVFIERFEHLLPKQHFGFILIYLLLVVTQGPAGRGARFYIRNHSLACLAKLRISILRAFNSRVRCSSMAICCGIAMLEKCTLMTFTT